MANVCETCGDEGWVEALVFCDSCKLGAVHRYCCGITPVPIDGYVTWFCSDCDESDSASDSTQVEHQVTSNVEVSSSPEPETRDIPSTTISLSEAGDGASVLEMGENEKNKKKRKIMTHSLPDDTVAETMEVSKKQEGSENGKSDELNGSEKSGKRKKKKKKKADKGEEKKNREGSNHFSPVQETEGHELQATTTSVEPTVKESKKRKSSESKESERLNVLVGNEVSVLKKSAKKKKNEESSTHTLHHALQDVTSVEAMKESTMPKSSESRESEGLNVLAGSEVSVLEKNAKKKKKKKRNEENSYHTSPVLKAVECGHQNTTSLEATKESKKQKTSASKESVELVGSVRNEVSVLEKSGKKKKKKKRNEESSNHSAPVLANDTDNVEPEKAQESSASRKPHESAGLEKNEASLSEGGNSTNVPDHSSCTTSKKRRLSSGNIKVTCENMELPAINSSFKEAESNMPQTNEVMPALNNARAQPICTPVWRGSVTVKQGNICSVHGLVAHLSTLACEKVYEKAGSLRTRLSAEMFRRLEIWPPGFLKNGPPTEESIALYFFPSSDSNGEKVYYSLLDEMKKKDMGMRCVLEDAELLFFTSYQLPLHCWKFDSKEYLWGIFRRRKT